MNIKTLEKIWSFRLLAIILWGVAPITVFGQSIQRITVAGQQAILKEPRSESAGAANADVTVVEYFDYNCPYCKELAPTFQELLAQDHKIAILYKDWPIFGGVSVYAARAALAAQWQGKYLVAHDALIAGPRLAEERQGDATLQKAGVNLTTLKKDQSLHAEEIYAALARNNEEARALGLKGTPGIIIGRELLPGTANLSALQQIVETARHEK
jgi:protein-disulfide isomerase